MEIRIDLRNSLIIFLTVIILVLGAYFYRGYEMQMLEQRNTQTQVLLRQLQFSPNIVQLFSNLGWQVQEIIPPPTPPPKEKE